MTLQHGKEAVTAREIASLTINAVSSPSIIVHTYVWIKIASAFIDLESSAAIDTPMICKATHFVLLTSVVWFRI